MKKKGTARSLYIAGLCGEVRLSGCDWNDTGSQE